MLVTALCRLSLYTRPMRTSKRRTVPSTLPATMSCAWTATEVTLSCVDRRGHMDGTCMWII